MDAQPKSKRDLIFGLWFAANLLYGQANLFVTGFALSGQSLRNDFAGWVGMKITVGGNPLSISSLGRLCVAGNSQAHNVKLVNTADGSDVQGATISVGLSGCTPGQFVFASINPITLPAGGSYYLVSQEVQNGDRWYDQGAVSATSAAVINGSVYAYNGSWFPLNSGNTSYVPPNFQYTTVISSPVTVTVQANPGGPSFTVDSASATTAQALTWASGSSHTIATASPQSAGNGIQYAWTGWSDGGAISHSVAPVAGTTYTASFQTQYQWTANVSPTGGGSIVTSPSATGNYFDSGAPVQLTAVPSANCSFVTWSGALSGGANPQTVTMSAPQSATATFQCSGPPPASFVSAYALGGQPLRNDFGGWVGMKLAVGSNPLTVSALGRLCAAGNSQTHTVKFVNGSDGSDLVGGSASVSMAGCTVGQFVYNAIAPITLAAGAGYYLVSQETQNGDRWYDQGAISGTSAATIQSAVYSYNGSWFAIGAANTSYVPPNFQYTSVVSSPVQVSVQASPIGASFAVDGLAYTTPQTFVWTSGTPHTIAASSTQNAGTQYTWTSWSDGGAISHTVSPASSVTYTASFATQYSLTTSVLPAGGGTIAASSSNGGYYASGASVQLTATPASNCSFLNWSGALTGSANPQSVALTNPESVTANFQCSGPPPATFVTGYALSGQPLRNDFSGWVGMKITVGANPLSVSSLGRICATGNSQTHSVKLVNAGSGTDVPGASATVNLTGCSAGQSVFLNVAPILLPAGTSYYLVSQEAQGGDKWYDQGAVSSANVAAINSSVYLYAGSWYPVGGGNTSYVPPNFQYLVVTPTPIQVTVQAHPSGPAFSVDGSSFAMPQTQTWTSGASHTIAVASPQNGATGTQYAWTSWSDGGAISHAVSPSTSLTFTATFVTQYLLNTSVSPAGGGTVNANPSAASGYYDANTPVQLTATPAFGCTFSGWSAGLSGTANPQTVTMASPQSVAAVFQCAEPTPSSSFITAFALNGPTLRRDFSGWVGMKLTVGATPLTVSALGRICVAGNSQAHTVKLANASDGTDVPGASVAVTMAGCTPGQFAYGTIGPVTLPSGVSYYLASQETQGGDLWYDQGRVSSTNAGVVNSAVYFYAGNWIPVGGGNTSYVPPNFQYTVPTGSGGRPADLSAYWSFDTANLIGSILIDQSSYANNASAYSLASVPGKIGQAIQLNGLSSHASVPNGSHLDLINDLTLAVWVKTTNSSRTEAVLSKYDAGGSEYGYILRTNPAGTAEVQFGASNVASGNRVVTDPTKINDGQWHHIAAVVNLGSSVSFYIDGVPSSTTPLATLAVVAGPDFQIGVNPYTYYGNYFTGSIDEVRVYSRALSASEVYALYNPSASGAAGAPAVSVTSPATVAQIAGVITLSASASSNAGIYYVQFLLDGVGILPGVTSSPYSALWDSTHASSGPHTLTALATDNAGHSIISAGVNITVTNPPVVSGGLPTGLWPAGSNQLTLSVSTNEPATCRYSSTPSIGYLAMTGFSTSGGTTHSTPLNDLQDGQIYNFYVRCQDSFSNVDNTDYTVSFSIAAQNLINGLAQTPPMGWNPWNHFREQISDTLIRQTADAMVSSGMRDAGYTYVVIDGGWEAGRDASGVLLANSNFPDMKALADYVHSKGLKLGIYSSPGPLTCDSLPGSYGYVQQDANLFAQWRIDYLKYDLCSASMIYPSVQLPVVYKLMGDALSATGRPIMYSICEYGEDHVWTWGASAGGNLWRTTSDILDNWNTMSGIGFSQTSLYPYAGPGHWNDPDMLEIGNGGMTSDEYRTHFSLWSILAAPLMAGNDVRGMTHETISILLNTDLIAVDQDAAGVQGHQLSVAGNQEIWVKPLSGGAVAVGLFNRDSQAANMSVQLTDLGISGNISVRDLWAHQSVTFQGGSYEASVPPHGVVMLRVTPAP